MNKTHIATLLLAATISLGFALRQSTDRPGDHYSRSYFKVEIEGVTDRPFVSVSGLEATTDVVEFRDGSDATTRRRPGATRVANVVLRRGYTGSSELWDWYKTVMEGRVERKSASIILLGTDLNEIERYNLFEAWPVRYRNYELDTQEPGVLVEEVELVVERIERSE